MGSCIKKKNEENCKYQWFDDHFHNVKMNQQSFKINLNLLVERVLVFSLLIVAFVPVKERKEKTNVKICF